MDYLRNLPDRGCFSVLDGVRMQAAPVYVCCHNTPQQSSCVIRNGSQALHDLYKQAQKRHSAAATAATKRQARQQLEDRSSKRQHQAPATNPTAGDGGLETALAAVAGPKHSGTPAAAAAATKGAQAAVITTAAAVAAAASTSKQTAVAVLGNSRGGNGNGFAVLKPAAAAAGSKPGTGVIHGSGSSSSSKHRMFSVEELKGMVNKELVELLRARSCPVSGSKTELVKRLLDYQRRLKKATQG